MTIDETEITRIRYEDLSDSLKAIIDDLASYNDEDYNSLRTRIASMSDSINVSTSVCSGDEMPKSISLGKTVYFNTVDNTVQIADNSGDWLYLN